MRLVLLPLLVVLLVGVVIADEDYYKILGVEKDADDRTIRKAFKKLAIQKHPDKNKDNPGAHAEFVKINKAYEVLKDEEMRKRYDQYGEKGLEDGFQGGNTYQSWQFYNENFGELSRYEFIDGNGREEKRTESLKTP
ncbi:DnaJ domain protein [Cooperia oncophora]